MLRGGPKRKHSIIHFALLGELSGGIAAGRDWQLAASWMVSAILKYYFAIYHRTLH